MRRPTSEDPHRRQRKFDNENEDYLDYPDYVVLSDVVFSEKCIKNERTGRCDTPRMAISDDYEYIYDDTNISMKSQLLILPISH